MNCATSPNGAMSALGQKQTLDWRPLMSALPPKADIPKHDQDVPFVPKADSCTAAKRPLAELSVGCVRSHKLAAKAPVKRLRAASMVNRVRFVRVSA
jgi:hypothetical protein